MKFIVMGTGKGSSRDAIMATYPRHKAFLDAFTARGDVIGIGPFVDGKGGNLAIFRSRAAAEEFAKGDPFVLEGHVANYDIREWGDQMLA